MSVLISLTIDWMNIGGFDGIDEFTEKLAILQKEIPTHWGILH